MSEVINLAAFVWKNKVQDRSSVDFLFWTVSLLVFCHQMVMPGNREDMADFQERASANCLTLVQLVLPLINLYIPDQKFYEVLYNRYNNPHFLPSEMHLLSVLVYCSSFGYSPEWLESSGLEYMNVFLEH